MFTFRTHTTKTLADTHTVVQLYYQIRDIFPNSLLLESSDYKSKENSYSYLCLDPIAAFCVDKDFTRQSFPNGKVEISSTSSLDISTALNSFLDSFKSEVVENHPFTQTGFFGYTSYDAIPLFENIEFRSSSVDIPLIQYQFFKTVIVLDHFHNNLYICEQLEQSEISSSDALLTLFSNKAIIPFNFKTKGSTTSNFSDTEFLEIIKKGQSNCFLGDVFQLVLSRKFMQEFEGDDFNVYRSLRSINPSPYLFYFDYGNFKVFGSSPEAQLTIRDNKAQINPIAGTFRRSGNAEQDLALGEKLKQDPKEVAEHMMLVDLARNDLSKNSTLVTVESFKEVEFYSHVIHLVSKVTAKLEANYNPITILGDTYPAGTLSGAPKLRAMQLIEEYEPESRGLYGGAIGFIGLDKSFNHAIFIRSFLSKEHKLTYQAGCGIVTKSDPIKELEEVSNKVGALKQAIINAENI